VKRVPFDSFCLAAAVTEMQSLIGGRVQKIVGIQPLTLSLGVYRQEEEWLTLSAHADFARAHLGRRPPRGENHPFALEARRRLLDGRIVFCRQRGLDRILEIGIATEEGNYQIVAELMGKHSNLMIVAEDRRVVAAAKWVGAKQSRRPVLPGQPYAPPPFEAKPHLLDANPGEDLRDFEGVSPFLLRLIEAGLPLTEVQEAVQSKHWRPEYSSYGAYPLPIHSLYPDAVASDSFSRAVDLVFREWEHGHESERLKHSLRAVLSRVADARRAALVGVDEARETARKALELQRDAELILAYQGVWQGGPTLQVWDYEGQERTLKMDPEKTAVENAERLFRRAKRARERAGEMEEQAARLRQELTTAESYLAVLETASEETLAQINSDIESRRWKHLAAAHSQTAKEERPFGGFAIRESLSPGGWKVLHGENATSNDYLTTKVARPNDYWFHVRGGVGSHVVLATHNQPTRVQKEDILFAATIAKRNSPSKHATYVAVDYTLKKYVRKPRASAPGFVVYTHEKTVHVEE